MLLLYTQRIHVWYMFPTYTIKHGWVWDRIYCIHKSLGFCSNFACTLSLPFPDVGSNALSQKPLFTVQRRVPALCSRCPAVQWRLFRDGTPEKFGKTFRILLYEQEIWNEQEIWTGNLKWTGNLNRKFEMNRKFWELFMNRKFEIQKCQVIQPPWPFFIPKRWRPPTTFEGVTFSPSKKRSQSIARCLCLNCRSVLLFFFHPQFVRKTPKKSRPWYGSNFRRFVFEWNHLRGLCFCQTVWGWTFGEGNIYSLWFWYVWMWQKLFVPFCFFCR